jgi:hypothetical protein
MFRLSVFFAVLAATSAFRASLPVVCPVRFRSVDVRVSLCFLSAQKGICRSVETSSKEIVRSTEYFPAALLPGRFGF